MSDLADGWAWIDGDYVPIAEARARARHGVHALRPDLRHDRRVGGAFFRLHDHLDRFERGLERLRLRSPVTRAELVEILIEVVRRSGLREA